MTIQQNAFVTGADRGLGLALCEDLLERNWRVFAGQHRPSWPQLDELRQRFPDALHIVPIAVDQSESTQAAAQAVGALAPQIDLLINNAGVISATSARTIRESPDYAEMRRQFEVNTLGPLRVVESFLPLTDRSPLKRLCFVSSDASSIARGGHTAWFGYTMSKAALNRATQILFKHLRPAGYTFRLYHPGWIRSYMWGHKDLRANLEPEEAAVPALAYFLDAHIDEDTLVLRDWQGQDLPW
jgi:NAD(P)-dependent dehydrogenase (short-subunit alcohol dehydrogenase family)